MANLCCNVTPIHFFGSHEVHNFLWMKSSSQQDTLVGQPKDGPISVLKIRDNGVISRFVLDPKLVCAFWDDDDFRLDYQRLFTQARNGDIIVYKVDSESVSEVLHILMSKLISLIDPAHHGSSPDEPLLLVAFEQNHIVLTDNTAVIASVQVTSLGSLLAGCVLKFPQKEMSASKGSVNLFQVVNGVICLVDPSECKIYMYSVSAEDRKVVFDFRSLGLQITDLLSWKVSYDHSSIMFVRTDLHVHRILLKTFAEENPHAVITKDKNGKEKLFNYEYFNYHLCQLGDSCWQKEITDYHVMATAGKLKKNMEKDVNGFKISNKKNAKYRSNSKSTDDTTRDVMDLSSLIEDKYKFSSFEATSDVLTILLTRKGTKKDETAICFANFQKDYSYLHRLEESSCAILSSKPSACHMIWTERYIQYVTADPDLRKDDLISCMMRYSGLHVADNLCQVNEWTRTAIPLSALEASLQQRQLDTLDFFFKSKQGLFTNMKQAQRLPLLANEMQQLEAALHLVMDVVATGVRESQARLFAQRLLSITLDFLYLLLEDAKNCLPKESSMAQSQPVVLEEEIQESCQRLQGHVCSLRKFMQQFKYRGTTNRSNSSREGSIYDVPAAMDEVDAGSDISIEQSIKDNKLTQLQSRMKVDDTTTYKKLLGHVMRNVQKHLQNKDISSCQKILANLGCDVNQTLWNLSQFYDNRSLQEFITSQLIGTGLNQAQREIVQLMTHLYKTYPNVSFKSALKMKTDDPSKSWDKTGDPLKAIIPAVDVFLPSHFADFQGIVSPKDADSVSHLYSSILLAWLSQWSEESKRRVFVDAKFLSTGNISHAQSVMKEDPEETWKFLVSHNLIDIVQSLLKTAGSDEDFPWPADLLSSLKLGSSYLRKLILRQLLRIGKLSITSAKDHGIDIHALLPIVGGPMKNPHVLAYAGTSTVMKFHQDFIMFCVNHGLQLPLWIYCNIHDIDIEKFALEHKTSWFSSFKLILSIPTHSKERPLMVDASKTAAGDLWSSPPAPMSVEAMLSQGHAMAAMATLSYMSQCDGVLGTALIEKYLNQYPKLMLALLPEDSPSSQPVTTVYELLMGNVPFNLRRLFGWHGTNPFAGEDSSKFMPHFSEPSMMAVHPCRRKLAFPFYLKQGRPVYAFQAFMSEELDKRDSPISEKKIQHACGIALWLACQNFNTSYITSSCVVFVELLGQDSALVRCMIHAGRLMLASRSRDITDDNKRKSQEDSKKMQEEKQKVMDAISSELQACVQSRHRHGPKFIATLQNVVTELIEAEGLERTSNEASQKWLLVVMLCQLLHLPLTSTFLEACAKSDNWLMFLWFAQLHQYPTHQLLSLLHQFQSPCYRDHLHYIICNAENKLFSPLSQLSSASPSSSDALQSKGDQRAGLYQKIGVTKETALSSSDEDDDTCKDKKRKNDITSGFSSRIRHAEFHECEMPESTAPDDVFRLLFYSQSMPCQWRCLLAACVSLRNPLFAELAASCGCPPVPSICGWLLASLSKQKKDHFLSQHGQMVSKWKLDNLDALIDLMLCSKCEDALATAFTILQPNSPLTSFFCFNYECVKKGKYSSTKTYLNQFKDAMASFETKPVNDSSGEKTVELKSLGDRAWMEKVVYQVLIFNLAHMTTVYEAYHFLGSLDANNIALVFGFDVMNFSLLYQVVEILHNHEIPDIDLVPLLTSGTSSPTFLSLCMMAVDFLIREEKFQPAMQLSDITKINKEKVALSQLRAEKEKLLQCKVWTSRNVRIQFWDRACNLMTETKCSDEACDAFFTEELKSTSIEYEKSLLCQHLLSLLEQSDKPDSVLDMKRENVFRNMWKHRITAQMSIDDQEPLDRIFNDELVKIDKEEYLKSDIARTNPDSQTHEDTSEDLTSEEVEILNSLIGQYLDEGKVRACDKVAAVFGHYNQDLTILKTCISLASGECTLDRIEPAMKRLVSRSTQQLSQWMKQKSFSRSRSLSVTSVDLNSVSSNIEFISKNEETITLMEKLYEYCERGRKVCLRIVTCYKIAEIIDSTYQDIVFGGEFDILQQILKTDYSKKFGLAKNFLNTSGLPDEKVAMFLASYIVDMLKKMVQADDTSGENQVDRHKWVFNSVDSLKVSRPYLVLCKNTSLLGDHILQAVASFIPNDDEELSTQALTMQTEIIITAHECYASASNMEGISHVLRAARFCTNSLAQAGEFNLMIRLLLGVGRYSEMMYIFHALQQNHQFELLLRKGMDREDKLKVAILDYLKRYQPNDSEAYTMVALKFTMFRDIAAMLEKCGHKALKTLKNKRPLENSKDNQEVLKKCLQFYKDAAESYVKDSSVRKAHHCVRLARLIALQLQLLSNGTVVIHLSTDEVMTFINTHTRFIEAMIVAEAYERRANWAEGLYLNAIVAGEKSYLQELQLHVTLTPALIEDVINVYKRATVKPSGALVGIRKLLTQCKDAQLQFKLASQLGLTDIVTSMLKSDTGSFLQDISVL